MGMLNPVQWPASELLVYELSAKVLRVAVMGAVEESKRAPQVMLARELTTLDPYFVNRKGGGGAVPGGQRSRRQYLTSLNHPFARRVAVAKGGRNALQLSRN